MITPSFSLTATERVLPRLALDFTTASLDPRITFTRALNTATVVNSSGNVAPINADLPRFDYDPITLACKGLLIEEARTNILLNSENFSAASWATADSSVDTNVSATTDPSGAQTADKLKTTTAAGVQHSLLVTVNVTSGVSYTHTYYAKKGEINFFFIGWSTPFFGAFNPAYFNLDTGAVTTGTGTTATMTAVGNGWYRCSATRAAIATGAVQLRIGLTDSNTSTLSTGANNTDGIYLWGAQLEAGAFATSYIPTEATALTRNADVATMTGTNFSDWYNQTEGSFVGFFSAPISSVNKTILDVNTGSGSNSININTVNTNINLYVFDGSLMANVFNGPYTANTLQKFASTYATNNFATSVNGNAAVVDSLGTVPGSMIRVRFGSQICGHIAKILYYPQKFTNAELSAFSK